MCIYKIYSLWKSKLVTQNATPTLGHVRWKVHTHNSHTLSWTGKALPLAPWFSVLQPISSVKESIIKNKLSKLDSFLKRSFLLKFGAPVIQLSHPFSLGKTVHDYICLFFVFHHTFLVFIYCHKPPYVAWHVCSQYGTYPRPLGERLTRSGVITWLEKSAVLVYPLYIPLSCPL